MCQLSNFHTSALDQPSSFLVFLQNTELSQKLWLEIFWKGFFVTNRPNIFQNDVCFCHNLRSNGTHVNSDCNSFLFSCGWKSFCFKIDSKECFAVAERNSLCESECFEIVRFLGIVCLGGCFIFCWIWCWWRDRISYKSLVRAIGSTPTRFWFVRFKLLSGMLLISSINEARRVSRDWFWGDLLIKTSCSGSSIGKRAVLAFGIALCDQEAEFGDQMALVRTEPSTAALDDCGRVPRRDSCVRARLIGCVLSNIIRRISWTLWLATSWDSCGRSSTSNSSLTRNKLVIPSSLTWLFSQYLA